MLVGMDLGGIRCLSYINAQKGSMAFRGLGEYLTLNKSLEPPCFIKDNCIYHIH
jgi:hypothetical protein